MENNNNENLTPEVKPEEVNLETTEDVANAEISATENVPETDITGQPIADESSYVKTPEQIKAERKEKWKKLVFGDKSAEKKEPMDKQDVFCYLGAFVCFLLALLPFLLRTFDPMYDRESFFNIGKEKEKEKVAIKKLHCSKTTIQTGYSYIISTEGTYTNNAIDKLEITYRLAIEDPNLTYDAIEIPEFVEFSAVDSDAVTENVEQPNYKVIIDFKNENINKVKTQPPIKDHALILPSQRERYSNEGFSCIVENMTPEEDNNG